MRLFFFLCVCSLLHQGRISPPCVTYFFKRTHLEVRFLLLVVLHLYYIISCHQMYSIFIKKYNTSLNTIFSRFKRRFTFLIYLYYFYYKSSVWYLKSLYMRYFSSFIKNIFQIGVYTAPAPASHRGQARQVSDPIAPDPFFYLKILDNPS